MRQLNMQAVDTAGNALLDAINRNKIHLATFIVDAVEHNAAEVINIRDFKGKTPVTRAVYITEEKSRQRAMLMLLQRGANPNLRDDLGRTALSYACELRVNDAVRMLVKWNVDPDLPDCKGMTPLMYCAIIGNDVGIGILIKSFRRLGLAVDRENDDGFTALHLAAKEGHMECANRLALEGHASTTHTDRNYGRSAEEWARAEGCTTPEVEMISHSHLPRRYRHSVSYNAFDQAFPSPERHPRGSPKKYSSPRRAVENTRILGIDTLPHMSMTQTNGSKHRSPKRHETFGPPKSPIQSRHHHKPFLRQGAINSFDNSDDEKVRDLDKSNVSSNRRVLNRSRIPGGSLATGK